MKKKIKTQKATRSTHARAIDKIAQQYQRRLENPQDPRFKAPTSNAAGHLRIMIYRMASKPDGKGRGKSAKAVERTRCRPVPRLFPSLLGDVFDQLGKTSKGDRDRLRLIVHELELAAESRVPPKYLIGFIHQNGGSKGIEKLRAANARAIQASSSSSESRCSRGRRETDRSKVAGSKKRRRKNRPGKRPRRGV